MIPIHVKKGLRAYCRVSGIASVLVEVVATTDAGKYIVRRVDTGETLRKPRGPGALHEEPGPWALAPAARKSARAVPAPVESIAANGVNGAARLPAPARMPGPSIAPNVALRRSRIAPSAVIMPATMSRNKLDEIQRLYKRIVELPEEKRVLFTSLIDSLAPAAPVAPGEEVNA